MPPSTLSIRQALSTEAQLLKKIGARTFRDTFAPDNDPTDLENYISQAFTIEQMTAELHDPTSTFLIATLENQPVGYSKLQTGPAPACITGKHPIELCRLYLDQSYIGKGIGKALMQACFEHAHQQDKQTMWLGVWEHNHRAKTFYTKWGFSKVGHHQFILGSDIQTDELMMCSVKS